jgi:purine-binding chemotaxis protein CheW
MADTLLFSVDARRYAIPLQQVSEVVPAVNVHGLPGAPAIVEGVVNVRGEILPVLSLRARMGHAAREVQSTEYFILVQTLSRRVILRSDTTPEIMSLSAIPDLGGEPVDRALAGVLPLPEGIALFHDVDRFMTMYDDSALDAALADAGSVA